MSASRLEQHSFDPSRLSSKLARFYDKNPGLALSAIRGVLEFHPEASKSKIFNDLAYRKSSNRISNGQR